MVRINNFEVNVLTSTDYGAKTPDWTLAREYKAQNANTYVQGRYRMRYIAVPKSKDSQGFTVQTPFAIQFKLHGPLSDEFMGDADMIVFRVYHDGNKIGSGHVKRRDWKRQLTYTTRKSSRRIWLTEEGSWVKLSWHLEEGLHGQLRVEVWREINSTHRSGSWDAGLDVPVISYAGADFVDFAHPTVWPAADNTRVRCTKRVDTSPAAMPDAEFVFEYRSEETLRNIGIVREPTQPTVKSQPVYDLTGDDNETNDWSPQSNARQVYSISEISDSPVVSPIKTVSSNSTYGDYWNNGTTSNTSSDGVEQQQYVQPIDLTNYDQNTPAQLSNFYPHGYSISDFQTICPQQIYPSEQIQSEKFVSTHSQVIDLTMDD